MEKESTKDKKVFEIYKLLKYLVTNKGTEKGELYPTNEALHQDLFGGEGNFESNEKTLRRYLDDIYTLYQDVLVTEKKTKPVGKTNTGLSKKTKVTIYRVPDDHDVSNVLKYFMETTEDYYWVIQMLYANDPKFLKSIDEKERVKKDIEKKLQTNDTFLFASKPFEIFEEEKEKLNFKALKQAVSAQEYRSIVFENIDTGVEYEVKEAKCIKIVYSNNNWYIAFETKEKKLRLRRIKHVKSVSYCSKNNYQKNVLQKYVDFFDTFESPFAKPEDKIQTAVLEVSSSSKKYFLANSKKFFRTQRLCENEQLLKDTPSENILIEIDYRDPMEILPFIQQWIPDIRVRQPKDLNKRLKSRIRDSIKIHQWKMDNTLLKGKNKKDNKNIVFKKDSKKN